jgi:hypothetical protein
MEDYFNFLREDNLNIFLNGNPNLFLMVDGQTLFVLKAKNEKVPRIA